MLRRILNCYTQVRCVRTVSKKRILPKNTATNPGIEYRRKMLEMESPYYENLEEDCMDLDDLESDFTHVGEMHREYEREKIRASTALSYAITKSKYFKPPKLPNLLTWCEKEQIRYLNQLDPKEWHVENLWKYFPSTPHVMKKILKSKWKPKDKNALERHDKAVERNWILLKEGKFDLEDELRCHLLKFSSRKVYIPTEESHNSKQVFIQPLKSSEFLDLLNESTVRGLQDDNEISSKERNYNEVDIPEFISKKINPRISDPKSDSYVMPMNRSRNVQLMSYKEFKETLVESVAEDAEKDGLSKKYHDYLNEGSGQGKVEPSILEENRPKVKEPKRMDKLTKYKKEDIEINLTSKQLDVFVKTEDYRHKIKIPEEKRDPSAVYKVNDCFYDSDGKFLYKVPGIK